MVPAGDEAAAREKIDALLALAGWHVCDANAANIHAARGVAIREFPLPGYGFAGLSITAIPPLNPVLNELLKTNGAISAHQLVVIIRTGKNEY